MFEDTVLRFADKERQQQLAELEQALEQRRAALDARQKNLAYRQDWMRKDPLAVSQAIEQDDRERKEEKRMAHDASEIKKRFGLNDRELIDTAAMRGALEHALAEKDVQQQMQADRITDRSSLLSGLNRLALIDAAKAGEILHANKEINPPREYTRQEVAEMFAKAQSHVDAHGRKHSYAKTLDGWAQSLEARKRELELAEIKLDAQEQALRAQVERALGATKDKSTQQEPLENGAGKVMEPAIDRGQPAKEVQSPANQAQEATKDAAPASATNDKLLDVSFETLSDPKKFEAAVEQLVTKSGLSETKARDSLEFIRNIKSSVSKEGPEKDAVDKARDAFFARGDAISKGKVVDIGERRENAARTMQGRSAESPAPTEANKDGIEGQQADGAKSRAALGIEGFRSLNRNRTKAGTEKADGEVQRPITEAATPAADRAGRSDAKEKDRDAERDGRATGKPDKVTQAHERGGAAADGNRTSRQDFRTLNAHERIERRAVFFGDIREAAGFTRDGKQALSEKAKEAVRPGKQRDGYGVA